MIPYELAIAIPAVIALAGYLMGYRTGRCSKDNPCAQCSFHVNEQRMARATAEQERVDEAKANLELRHDAAHKGWGWATGEPDIQDCPDATCSRNKRS